MDLIQRADFALADLVTAGMLNPEQSDKFFEQLINQPTLLNDVRVVPMNAPQMEINKMKFGSRILRAGQDGAGSRAIFSGSRAVDASNRAKPDTSKVQLTTKEYIAEVRLSYEVLEDNIEHGTLQDTVMRLMAQRISLDLEEMLLLSDTGSGDAFLALQNGVLSLITSNQVDAAGGRISAEVFNNAIKALPTQFRRNLAQMRFYAPHNVVADYRLALAGRGTSLGDSNISANIDPTPFGVPMRATALMPDSNIVFTDPKNIILGLQRNVRIETDKDIQTREYIVVATIRAAIQLEEEIASVKIKNLG